MTEPIGKQMQSGPTFQLVIQFTPSQGALGIAWPNTDFLTKLAMLEAAKTNLLVEVVKQATGQASGIVTVPPGTKLA